MYYIFCIFIIHHMDVINWYCVETTQKTNTKFLCLSSLLLSHSASSLSHSFLWFSILITPQAFNF